ncbi:nucleoside recognition protein [candidate division KSB1 bacterium]|nr:nucleoside recognition protein [candidate division KSB1 bacterium]
MLNYIWLGLMVLAIIVGLVNHRVTAVTEAAFEYAKLSVTIAFDLIGIMALWLGIMNIAEKAGLIELLAKLFKPIGRRLFPEVPPEHPAMGSMILCIAASWLGLGNAATPLGLKAMEELQKLNPQPDTATNSQALFLTLNTASVTLIPATIIGVRVALGSANPAEIIGPTIFASGCATVVGVLVTKLLERLTIFKIPIPPLPAIEAKLTPPEADHE